MFFLVFSCGPLRTSSSQQGNFVQTMFQVFLLNFPSVFFPCVVGLNPVFRQIGLSRITREMNKVADELAGRALQHNHAGMWIHKGFHDSCKVGVVQMSDAGIIRTIQQKTDLVCVAFATSSCIPLALGSGTCERCRMCVLWYSVSRSCILSHPSLFQACRPSFCFYFD